MGSEMCIRDSFWEAVISATGDELIGLTCGQEMQAPTLHGLGLAIMTSHSLAQPKLPGMHLVPEHPRGQGQT